MFCLKAVGWEWSITHPPIMEFQDAQRDLPWLRSAGSQLTSSIYGYRDIISQFY